MMDSKKKSSVITNSPSLIKVTRKNIRNKTVFQAKTSRPCFIRPGSVPYPALENKLPPVEVVNPDFNKDYLFNFERGSAVPVFIQ